VVCNLHSLRYPGSSLCLSSTVASVIGSAKHPKYTLFGTTVNTASRMESSSLPNRVQCTAETMACLRETGIPVMFRQKMEVKGRGELDTYFVEVPPDGLDQVRPKGSSSGRSRKTRLSMGDISSSIGSENLRLRGLSSLLEESEPTGSFSDRTEERTLSSTKQLSTLSDPIEPIEDRKRTPARIDEPSVEKPRLVPRQDATEKRIN